MPWSLTSTAQLNRIEQKLDQLLTLSQQETSKMAIDLTALTAEVANNTSVDASIVQLVQNLAAQIAAIPPSTDPTTQAALDALTATLKTNDGGIAAAVVKNTPAAPPSAAGASGPTGQ
jgi:hypothetical protein